MPKNILFQHLSVIFLISLIIYLPSFSAPFVFDDYGSIVNNLNLKNIREIGRIWQVSHTRFITNLSFAGNFYLGGLRVFDYHLVNFSIHVLGAFTLYFFALKITKNSLLSFFSALIFALHPIQTQAVTYIVQRTASLATLFYLLCLYFYLKGRDKKINLVLSLIFASLSFFTKEISFTLPLSILLTDIFFIKRDKNAKKDRLILFFVYSLLLIIIIAFQTGLINTPWSTLAVISRTTGQHTSTISRWDYFISQISVIGLYLRLLIVPINQNFDYHLPEKIGFGNPLTLFSFIPITFLLLFAILKKRKYPLATFSIFFFFIAISLESSVFPIEDLIFEHRLYLPMIGFSLASGYLLFHIINIIKNKTISKIILLTLFITLSILTFKRNAVYSSELSLWQDTARKSPQKARVRMALAAAYNKEGLLKEAISEYEKVLTLDPDRKNLSYNNLGLIYLTLKNEVKAKDYFIKALEEDPQDTIAGNNLANLLYLQSDQQGAINQYNQIITIDPENKEARRSLGYIYLNSGKQEDGITKFEEITKLPQRTDISFTELGDVYRSNNKLEKALSSYQKAINLNTRNEFAYTGLGKTYLLLGSFDQAKISFRKALRINPQNQDAQIGIKLTL